MLFIRDNIRSGWSQADVACLAIGYSKLTYANICAILDKEERDIRLMAQLLGLKKIFYPWNKGTRGGGVCKANNGSLKKGHIPWNTGTKGICKSNSGSFKKGNVPPNTTYDGCVSVRKHKNKRPYLWYRISKRKYIMYHVKLWVDNHGPVPAGYIVVFKNKDQFNCSPDNLEIITRVENMKRNTIHRYPDELKKTIRTLGKLKHLINAKEDKPE